MFKQTSEQKNDNTTEFYHVIVFPNLKQQAGAFFIKLRKRSAHTVITVIYSYCYWLRAKWMWMKAIYSIIKLALIWLLWTRNRAEISHKYINRLCIHHKTYRRRSRLITKEKCWSSRQEKHSLDKRYQFSVVVAKNSHWDNIKKHMQILSSCHFMFVIDDCEYNSFCWIRSHLIFFPKHISLWVITNFRKIVITFNIMPKRQWGYKHFPWACFAFIIEMSFKAHYKWQLQVLN